MSKEYPYTEDGLTYINKDYILQEFTSIKWYGPNKAHFVQRGYKFTKLYDDLTVVTTDLMKGSITQVMAMCPDCGKYRSVRFSGLYKNQHSICQICALNRIKTPTTPYDKGVFRPERLLGKTFDNFKVIGYTGKTDKGSQLFICDYSNTYNKKRNQGWIDKVKERDGICQVCGNKDDLVAHHLNNFADYDIEREEISNGITVCKSCHSEFHMYMGGTIKECTTKDFYKWYFIVKNIDVVKEVEPMLSIIENPKDILQHDSGVEREYTPNELLDMKSLFDPITTFGLDIFLAIEKGDDTIHKISKTIGETVGLARRNTHLLHKHGFLYKGSRTNDNSWHWYITPDIDWDEKFRLFDVLLSSHITNEQLLYELTYNVKHVLRRMVLTLEENMTLKELSNKIKRHKTTTRSGMYILRDLGIVEKKSYTLWGITDEFSNENGTKGSL